MPLRANRFTVAATLALCIAAAVFIVELIDRHASSRQSTGRETNTAEVFQVPLTEEEAALRQPRNAIDVSDLASRRIIGGVVPHHLLASEFLAEFFQLIANRSKQPKTIILISPNHFEVGEANIQTAEFLWETPYGQVSTETETLDGLLTMTDAVLTPESFGSEHGIYNILPYIAHFLPSTKVVPIVLRYNTSAQEIDDLVTFLRPLVESGQVLVVGSVDFSHYLPKDESDKKDVETLRAMQNFDLSQIANFQSDHMDSPATILTLLQLGQKVSAKEIRVLRHDNSADDVRGNYDSTTGHYSFFLTD